MTNLRVGLVGLGVMGSNHARVLSGLDGVDLVAIVDPDSKRVAGYRDVSTGELGVLWERKPDYVVIAAPTALHADLAVECAERGIHALIEKPLATNSEDAHRVVDVFESAGLIAGVGHIERFNAAVQQARARIAGGALGDVIQVSTRRTGPFPSRIYDVGVTMDLATHDIDLAGWVSGARYVSVSATAAYRAGGPHEDLVSVTGLLSGGVVVNHITNWLSPLKERTSIVLGDKGAFVIDTLTADLTHFTNMLYETEWDELAKFRGVSEGDVVRYAFPKPEPLRVLHANFRDAVLGKDSQVVSLREAAQTVAVAEAIVESALAGGELVRLH